MITDKRTSPKAAKGASKPSGKMGSHHKRTDSKAQNGATASQVRAVRATARYPSPRPGKVK